MLTTDLGGKWALRALTQSESSMLSISRLPRDEWIKASVPGVVHLELMSAGRIPDPFYRMNETKVAWVEDFDWIYVREFEVDESIVKRDAAELVFDGLDTFATVWLNGEKVGEPRDMFVEHRFDIKGVLRTGSNKLVVWFESPKRFLERERAKAAVKLNGGSYSPLVYGRKAQYSFGWDWGPRLPTTGIWRGVRLEAFDVARIEDVHVRTTLSRDIARIRAIITLAACKDEECELEVRCDGSERVATKRLALKKGENSVAFDFDVLNPRLWWASGYGEQALYALEARLTRDGDDLDKRLVRFGIRHVELVQESDTEGRSFVFKINGVPIFCKGANWVPPDSFLPRMDRASYEKLLSYAKEANMNMLRVWGGGVYEDNAFYELCDEKGIMIWQDFMFACGEYPEEGWFWKLVRDEAQKVIKRLRNHPCVVIWCGNNENDWGLKDGWWGKRERFFGETVCHRILPEICGTLDPDRPYWPSSPYGGSHPNSQSEGDRHSWEVWSVFKDYTEYRRDTGRFVSEFGFQSMPTAKTINSFTSPDDRELQSLVMEHHNKQVMGNERLYYFLSAHFKVPCRLGDFAEMTQINQGEALKFGIEHWRSRKFKTAGALIWQLNDCWPVSSWSLIDYGYGRKASYYYVKRAFAPIVVTLAREDDTIKAWVVNDELRELSGELTLRGLTLDGKSLKSRNCKVVVKPNSSAEVAKATLEDLGVSDGTRQVVVAELVVDGQAIAHATRLLKEPKHLEFPKPRPQIRLRQADRSGNLFEVSILSKVFIESANLGFEGTDAEYEDNYFDVLPGVLKVLTIKTGRRFKPTGLKKRLKLRDVTSYSCVQRR